MFSRGALLKEIVNAAFEVLSEIKEAREADSEEGERLSNSEIQEISGSVGSKIGEIVSAHLLARRK